MEEIKRRFIDTVASKLAAAPQSTAKDELVEECLKLGLDVLEDDTKDTLFARIKAATAE